MRGIDKISIPEAAKILNKSELFVRIAMQREAIDIGSALIMPGSTKYSYFVSPSRLAKEKGITVEEVFERVREIRCEKTEDTAS